MNGVTSSEHEDYPLKNPLSEDDPEIFELIKKEKVRPVDWRI